MMNFFRPLSFALLPVAALSACAKEAPSGRAAVSASASTLTPARHVVFLHMADSHAQLETHPEYMPGESPELQSMGG